MFVKQKRYVEGDGKEKYLFRGWYDTSMCNWKEQITLGKPFLGRELKWMNKQKKYISGEAKQILRLRKR